MINNSNNEIAVVGAGIIGICTSYFLQQSGFKVTLIDKEQPGTMTSYGHACTFADYANVPINDPSLFYKIPQMLFKKNSPLAVDFFYILKNMPWAINFLKNCRKKKSKKLHLLWQICYINLVYHMITYLKM